MDGQIAEILTSAPNNVLDVHLKKGDIYSFGFTRSSVSNKAYLYKDSMFITVSRGDVSYELRAGEISVNPRASGMIILLNVYLSTWYES